MGSAALSLPVNIPWKRLAFSYDMMDTQPDITALTDPTQFSSIDPPKWRSSISVFYHVADPATTSDQYPNGKILYLKISCSITGFNPSEEMYSLTGYEGSLLDQKIDNVQDSILETIAGSSWANSYYPCLGSICQISIFPSQEDQDALQNPYKYPFVIDFEPKKREVMETANVSNEYLTGSSTDLNVQKGLTNTQSLEQSNILTGVSASGGAMGVSASVGVTGEWGTRQNSGSQTVDNTTTDSSRQMRETVSHTSTINQMYQTFNAYHLGLNRALFVMMPRPHTISPSTFPNPPPSGDGTDPGEFNLINGVRMLEGVQDLFLVAYVPNDLKGICIKAVLDTGHTMPTTDFPSGYGQPAPKGGPAPQQVLSDIQTANNDINNAAADFAAINIHIPGFGGSIISAVVQCATAVNQYETSPSGLDPHDAYFVQKWANQLAADWGAASNSVSKAQTSVQTALIAQQNNDPQIDSLANSAVNDVGQANTFAQNCLTDIQNLQNAIQTLSAGDRNITTQLNDFLKITSKLVNPITTFASDMTQSYTDISTYLSDINPGNQAAGGAGAAALADFLLITRRVVSTCATFNQDNTMTPNLTNPEVTVPTQQSTLVNPTPQSTTFAHITQQSTLVLPTSQQPIPVLPTQQPIPVRGPKIFSGIVVSSEQLQNTGPLPSLTAKDGSLIDLTRKVRVNMVNQYNFRLQTIRRLLLNNISSGRYVPRPFTATEVFRRQIMATIARSPIPITSLIKLNYISKNDAEMFQKAGAKTLGDIVHLRNSDKVKGVKQKPTQLITRVLTNLQMTVVSRKAQKTITNKKVVQETKGRQERQKQQAKPNEPKANR